jgi:hypothetical protein
MQAKAQFAQLGLMPAKLVPGSAYPQPPILPQSWRCTALLHPFSPPQGGEHQPSSPFYQLCIANVTYFAEKVMSIQVTGIEYGFWWYKISRHGTILSLDKGRTWKSVDMGWTLPERQWLSSEASFFMNGHLNWMMTSACAWWKQPASGPNAATWIWFSKKADGANLPFRMMFGAPPPSPESGRPDQLAFFQNFAFIYFPEFYVTPPLEHDAWQPANITGLTFGNPDRLELVVWEKNFGMTTVMTPVDSASFPLPAYVLYRWADDHAYKKLSDRAQSTTMFFDFNSQSSLAVQQALMFGSAPLRTKAPAFAGSAFLISRAKDGGESCFAMKLGAEPPDWARLHDVQGRIHAVVDKNPALCPHEKVVIISVLFPSSDHYPKGRYLWTWYALLPNSTGREARPVTFMESASTIEEGGTSLALADYFSYCKFDRAIPDQFFEIPSACRVK